MTHLPKHHLLRNFSGAFAAICSGRETGGRRRRRHDLCDKHTGFTVISRLAKGLFRRRFPRRRVGAICIRMACPRFRRQLSPGSVIDEVRGAISRTTNKPINPGDSLTAQCL
uniref:Secreted protein n=1 Tax=Steinernema glaseri TaxID=37863 RepID=A0A1I8AE94_9BILA